MDANVFIHASLNRKEIGNKSRSIIRSIEDGRIVAATSALSFDELVWAVKKERGEKDGTMAGEIFLNTRELTIMDVKQETLNNALSLVKKHHLNPRDSIHLASALMTKADYVVSEDRDFDAITEIKRKPILRVVT